MDGHEEMFVRAFIVEAQRDRALSLLKKRSDGAKTRRKFDSWIGSQIDLDARFARRLPSITNPPVLLGALGDLSVPEICWVISTTASDRTEVAVADGVSELVDPVGGVVVSFDPGRVAAYASESPNGRLVLLVHPLNTNL